MDGEKSESVGAIVMSERLVVVAEVALRTQKGRAGLGTCAGVIREAAEVGPIG
jgi:glutamine amidotransferase PdxT